MNVTRYVGRRGRPGDGYYVRVDRVAGDGSTSPLPPRNDLRNHSPDGFEWGYGGSGPAQLALAILADAFGDEVAQRCYQDFKWSRIATIQADTWEIAREDLVDWLIDHERGDAP